VPFRFGVLHPSTFGSISGLLPTPERLLTDMVQLNVLLFFFNLVPLFPLDGWTVVLSLLPARPALWWQRHQQQSMYGLYGLILLTVLSGYLALLAVINPLTWLVGNPSNLVTRVLIGR
jgi:Zn-dependent protease